MTTKYPITGMSCAKCVAKIHSILSLHPQIASVQITLDPPAANVESSREIAAGELNEWLSPLGKYQIGVTDTPALPEKNSSTYRPLIVVFAYLFLVTGSVMYASESSGWMEFMRLFMGGFFVVFSFFKMLDLRGFADAYRGYDLIAKKSATYAFAYPFIELALGLSYLAKLNPLWVNFITAIIMAASLAGVLKAVLSKKSIRCACLGTVFQLPMSTVTIIEDAAMLTMALAMLIPTIL